MQKIPYNQDKHFYSRYNSTSNPCLSMVYHEITGINITNQIMFSINKVLLMSFNLKHDSSTTSRIAFYK